MAADASQIVCDQFRINPKVNPRTKRPIKIGGPAHRRLVKECKRWNTTPPPKYGSNPGIGSTVPSPPASPPPSPAPLPRIDPLAVQEIISGRLSSKSYSVINPLSNDTICMLINTKKKDKYIFTYDPSEMKTELMKYYREEDLHIFDWEVRDGCCRVISISLYSVFRSTDALPNIMKYLYSINQTVINVESILPDWIVRIYMDASVFLFFDDEYIRQFKHSAEQITDIRIYLNAIFESPNVEIYNYECPDITADNLTQIRSYRFLPLIDPEVAFCAVREADGVVSILDCKNLEFFASSPLTRLFYIPKVIDGYNLLDKAMPYLESGTIEMPPISSYAHWLTDYKKYFYGDYFKKHVQYYDLLAGTFACKLKIKDYVYDHAVNVVKRNISFYSGTMTDIGVKSFILGFDEILLLKIFFYFLTEKILDPQDLATRRNLLFYADKDEDMDVYEITYPYKYSRIMDQLKSLNINSSKIVPYLRCSKSGVKIVSSYPSLPPIDETLIELGFTIDHLLYDSEPFIEMANIIINVPVQFNGKIENSYVSLFQILGNTPFSPKYDKCIGQKLS